MRGLFKEWQGKIVRNDYPAQDGLSFARFMGLFITDGTLWKGKDTGGRITIVQHKKEGRAYIKKVLNDLSWKYTEREKEFRIHSTALYRFLRKYFPENQKKTYEGRVPYWIRQAPVGYINAFLEGAIVGDGNIHKKNGHLVIYTASKGMAGDYQELFLKVGLCSSVRVDDRRGLKRLMSRGNEIENKVVQYIVSVTQRTNLHLFSKKHWSRKHLGVSHSIATDIRLRDVCDY